jgi:Tol biopolymer transport system component
MCCLTFQQFAHHFWRKPVSKKLLIRICFVVIFVLGTAVTFLLRVNASPLTQETVPSVLERSNLPHIQSQDSNNSLPNSQQESEFTLVPWSNLVYQSYRDNNWEIYYANDGIVSPIRLTYHKTSDIHPRLNRGTTRIAFASNRDGDYEIYTMNVDGSGLVQITANTTDDVNPIWSPDGTKIAFEAYRDGQPEIYVMGVNGQSPTRLTFNSAYDASPAWSPDGSKIAFVSARTGGYRIYSINSDGSSLTLLSTQPYSFNPAWSPDGKQIAFDADGDGDGWQDLWLMNSDGSNQRMIYNPPGQKDAWVRSWSPNGQYIAFTEIAFIQNNGNWYWTYAYVNGFDLQRFGYTSLSSNYLDWNPDWQAADAAAPQSTIAELPEYSPAAGFQVYWSGTDFGESGIVGYDIQYRLGKTGTWTDWKTGTTSTTDKFAATPGTTVFFRSRARDYVYNIERWLENGDTSTTFYTWHLSGQVTDNRQNPLIDVPVTIQPAPLVSTKTGHDGQYDAWLTADGSHNLSVNRAGYSPAVTTALAYDNIESLYLPPQNNLIQNGAFEAAPQPLAFWNMSGTLPHSVTPNYRHTGQNGVFMGLDCPAPCLSELQDFPWAAHASVNLQTDSAGNLHVIWIGDYLGELQKYYHTIQTTDGTWSEPYKLSDDYITLPVAAIDQEDTLHLVWSDNNGGIYYKQRLATGIWSPTTLIDSNLIGTPSKMLIDQQGSIYVLVNSPAAWGLGYLGKTVGESWKFSKMADTYTSNAVMALGPDGSLHFVWTQDTNSMLHRFPIFYRVRYPNGKLSPTESLFENHDYVFPQPYGLIVAKNNTIHVFWHATNGTNHAYRLPNQNWTNPLTLSSINDPINPSLDSQGNIHLVYSNWITNTVGTYYRQWFPKTGWGTPIILNFSYTPSITVDQHDIVHLMGAYGLAQETSHQTSATSTTAGTSQLNQSVTIPSNMTHPTLAFMVRRFRDFPYDFSGLEVKVDNGNTVTTVPVSVNQAAWSHAWVDMSPWAGETVTVTFQLNQQIGDPYVQLALDDISLGSAYPDAWVEIESDMTNALRNDSVDFHITYGNQSSIGVQNAKVTVTLPARLSFINANIPPVSTSPLVWNLGDLPAFSQGQPIIITATVASTATAFETLTTQASIGTASAELQTVNNQSFHDLFIGTFVYLPIINKE